MAFHTRYVVTLQAGNTQTTEEVLGERQPEAEAKARRIASMVTRVPIDMVRVLSCTPKTTQHRCTA
jgi:hypothetical protein